MANSIYARYIPPPPQHDEDEEGQRQRKKPRTSGDEPANSLKLLKQDGKAVKAKKAKKTKKASREQSPSPPQEDDRKYAKIRQRYQKSRATGERPIDHADSRESAPSDAAIEQHGLQPLPQPPLEEVANTAGFAYPDWISAPKIVNSTENIPFASLSLHDSVSASLKNCGYEDSLAIQAAVLPLLADGDEAHAGDVCISASTGSGKTLAYVIPMINDLRKAPRKRLRGLVIVPTRDLVSQVQKVFERIGSGHGLSYGTATGRKSLREEQDTLVRKGTRYDPDAYQAWRKELNNDDPNFEWNLEELLGHGDDEEPLFNRVTEYTSKVDILICTPGRLVEHIQSTKGFTLDDVEWFVIDEADRLLDDSFQQWVDVVIPALETEPLMDTGHEQLYRFLRLLKKRRVRKIILSATMTKDMGKLATLKLKDPKLVVLENEGATDQDQAHEAGEEHINLPLALQEVGIPLKKDDDKPLYLIEVLERGEGLPKDIFTPVLPASFESEKISNEADDRESARPDASSKGNLPLPSQSHSPSGQEEISTTAPLAHGVLVFTATNESALRLSHLLSTLRHTWAPQIATLTKSNPHKKSRKALSAFHDGKIAILIATDRASRGLDIANLAHVINYDMPNDLKSYVHRVGRTARAGKQGKATTLVEWQEGNFFWNKIARGEVGRGERKVGRLNLKGEWGEEERKAYEKALERLGEDVRGGR